MYIVRYVCAHISNKQNLIIKPLNYIKRRTFFEEVNVDKIKKGKKTAEKETESTKFMSFKKSDGERDCAIQPQSTQR